MSKISVLIGLFVCVAFAFAVTLFSAHWLAVCLVGGALVVVSQLIPAVKESAKGGLTVSSKDAEILLPTDWDEHQIDIGFKRYAGDSNMLSKYVDGIVSRFIMGQESKTILVRSEYLEQFNSYAAIARESYKWHRYMKGGRAKLEEDAEDTKAEVAFKQAQADLELVELDKEIKRQEKLLQIEKLKREFANLNTPASTPVVRPSASETREQKRRDLKSREGKVLEEMRIAKANPTLSEDQKQRYLNSLEDTLAQIHEEQANLL